MIKYKTAKHCGGLKESMETEKTIDNEIAELLISAGIYKFYAYDDRIKAFRYLKVDLTKNFGLPEWINKYVDEV